jgi:DNA polymerase-1
MSITAAIPRPDLNEALEISTKMHELTGTWGVYLDFEYKDSAEPLLNDVCCSITYPFLNPLGQMEYRLFEAWLYDDSDKAELNEIMWYAHSIGGVFVAFNAAAEGRATEALGINPHSFNWVCLYSEWRQVRNNNNRRQYGRYLKRGGYPGYSVPPSLNRNLNKNKDNNEVGGGLADCIYHLFGDKIDTQHKNHMRDIIIDKTKRTYSDDERACITAYCTSDIPYLPRIWSVLFQDLRKLVRATPAEIHEWTLYRGSYVVSCAKMESLGIPLDKTKSLNLRSNVADAKETIIERLVTEHYPFYVRQRDTLKSPWKWVDKYHRFEQFVVDAGLFDGWPQGTNAETKKPSWVEVKDPDTKQVISRRKKLCRENDTLKKYDGIPEIYAYRKARKNLHHLNWFSIKTEADKAGGKRDIIDRIGSDFRLRPFYGFYGTQTGRNAPPASSFIFAMSNWLRCLVTPPKGKVIIAIDYASQEFAIAAILSGDKNMIEAYRSGDPYLYFAVKAGGVAAVDGEWFKEQKKLFEAGGHTCPDMDKYKHVANQRKLFKATVLGLQYGMGAGKLAIKITTDTGIPTTERGAQRLIDFHKKVFRKYWKWLDRSYDEYKRKKHLRLWCGWAVLGDNSSKLSILNAPVQGTGSSIMREAVRLAHKKGIDIICPLHDAIYVLADATRSQETADELAECMLQAVKNVIGDTLEIRLDIDIHDENHIWVEEKGEEDYNNLKEFLEPAEVGGRIQKLMNTVYKEPVLCN